MNDSRKRWLWIPVFAAVAALAWWMWSELSTPEPVANGGGKQATWQPPEQIGEVERRSLGDADATGQQASAAAATPGCRLVGTVIDEAQAVQAQVRVRLCWKIDGPRKFEYRSATTDQRGRFTFDRRLPVGNVILEVGDRILKQPKTIAILTGDLGTTRDVRLVVADESQSPTITGVVVDSAGKPVKSARVAAVSAAANGTNRSQYTGEDGRFVLRRQLVDSRSETKLHAQRGGFEEWRRDSVKWGRKGLRIELMPGLGVEVLVLQGNTTQPLEDFGLLTYRREKSRNGGSTIDPAQFEVQFPGRHAGGSLFVPRLQRGPWWFVVVPGQKGWAVSPQVAVDVTDTTGQQVVIRVSPLTKQAVHVVSIDGAPVVGSEVFLARGINTDRVDLRDRLLSRTNLRAGGYGRFAWRIAQAKTDTKGAAEVSGSLGETYAIVVRGPGHLPAIVQPITLSPAARPIRVEVTTGLVTVTGQLNPTDVLADYQPTEKALRRWRKNERKQFMPGVFLQSLERKQANGRVPPSKPGRQSVAPIAADGSFRIEGVPPGRWRLCLGYSEFTGRSRSPAKVTLLDRLEVRAGMPHTRVDLSRIRRAVFAGQVRVHGKVLAAARVALLRSTPQRLLNGLTDEQGRVSWPLAPGRYLPVLFAPDHEWRPILYSEFVEVAAGAKVDSVLDFAPASVRIQLVGGDGKPLGGVKVLAKATGKFADVPLGSYFSLGKTGADGRLQASWCSPGNYELRVLRRGLSKEDLRKLPNKGQIKIGELSMRGGTEPVAEVRLTVPASAGF